MSNGTPSVKIIETPERTSDSKSTLVALLVFGLILAVFGGLLIGVASGGSADVMRAIGWILAGVGGVLLQVAVVGFGVMLGVGAAAKS